MSSIRKDWGDLMAGYDDVVLDVFLMNVHPRKPLKAENVPVELLSPVLVLAVEEPRVVDDFEELISRMNQEGFPPLKAQFTWEASVYCIKHQRGEELRVPFMPHIQERIRKAAEAWR